MNEFHGDLRDKEPKGDEVSPLAKGVGVFLLFCFCLIVAVATVKLVIWLANL